METSNVNLTLYESMEEMENKHDLSTQIQMVVNLSSKAFDALEYASKRQIRLLDERLTETECAKKSKTPRNVKKRLARTIVATTGSSSVVVKEKEIYKEKENNTTVVCARARKADFNELTDAINIWLDHASDYSDDLKNRLFVDLNALFLNDGTLAANYVRYCVMTGREYVKPAPELNGESATERAIFRAVIKAQNFNAYGWIDWREPLREWSGYIGNHNDGYLLSVCKALRVLSRANVETALKIVNYCISKGWKNLYPLPEKSKKDQEWQNYLSRFKRN